MTLQSFETPFAPASTDQLEDGPVLEHPQSGTDIANQALRIRAHRFYPVSREELFDTWTRRTAWGCWMRLRARSRSTLSPHRGGSFRLELAEGPTIHVIVGTVNDIRPCELISLSWVHRNTADHGSTVDVAFRTRQHGTDLTLLHRGINSRREASWLMRLWSTALGRLGEYVIDDAPRPRRIADAASAFARSA